MWDREFSPEMLSGKVIIHCPNREQVSDLFEILRANDVQWAGGGDLMSTTYWDIYREQMCYRINGDHRLSYGSKGGYEENFSDRYSEYTSCYFPSPQEQEDFAVADKDEIAVLFQGEEG